MDQSEKQQDKKAEIEPTDPSKDSKKPSDEKPVHKPVQQSESKSVDNLEKTKE